MQKELKEVLILQIMRYKDSFQKEKTKKVIGLMKDYLTDDDDESKKAKGTKNAS